jgi:hypothetical protein
MGASNEFLARIPRRKDGKRNWPNELKARIVAENPRRISVTPAANHIFASANTGIMRPALALAPKQSQHQHHH